MNPLVFSIKKFAVHDGDGIRTTVFLKGCPLTCKWCHNPEGISRKKELLYMQDKCIGCGECVEVCEYNAHVIKDGIHTFDRSRCLGCGRCADVCLLDAVKLCGKEMTAEEVAEQVMQDVDFYRASGGGVTISGGECLLYADFCAEVFKILKQNDVNCMIDTSGYVSRESIDKVLPYTSMFLYDIKHTDEKKHMEFTGVSNKPIFENLAYINSKGTAVEIRIPLIPTFNDAAAEEIGEFLSEFKCIKRVRVLPYNNLIGSKYEALSKKCTVLDIPVPDEDDVRKFENTLKNFGLNTVG